MRFTAVVLKLWHIYLYIYRFYWKIWKWTELINNDSTICVTETRKSKPCKHTITIDKPLTSCYHARALAIPKRMFRHKFISIKKRIQYVYNSKLNANWTQHNYSWNVYLLRFLHTRTGDFITTVHRVRYGWNFAKMIKYKENKESLSKKTGCHRKV